MGPLDPQKGTFDMKRAKKPKNVPHDGGLGPVENARLRAAIRQVWHWTSYARKLCLKRALTAKGFSRCESCRKVVPKVYADHIVPCGKLDAGFIERLFTSSANLQALCKKCHDRKTREERNLIDLGLI